jgi:hypothetical protein
MSTRRGGVDLDLDLACGLVDASSGPAHTCGPLAHHSTGPTTIPDQEEKESDPVAEGPSNPRQHRGEISLATRGGPYMCKGQVIILSAFILIFKEESLHRRRVSNSVS